MGGPIFGSHGAESLLRALQPKAASGARTFPLKTPVPRFKSKSDLDAWVREIVEVGRPPEIEPGILICASVEWEGTFVATAETATRYSLRSAAVHAIIATNPEDSTAAAIAEGRSEYQYLRMDYNKDHLGPLFKEPAPHIHIVVDGEPRFAGSRVSEGLPVADFVDFIFRNYRHGQWARWLHEEWYTRFVEEEEQDIFEQIEDAYRGSEGGSNLVVLGRTDVRRTILQLRRLLSEEKIKRCPFSVAPDLWDIVAF